MIVLVGGTHEESVKDSCRDLCSPSEIETITDRQARPWFEDVISPVLSVGELCGAADLSPAGVVRWGVKPQLDQPGVYLVSRTEDPWRQTGSPCPPDVSIERVGELMRTCSDLTLDGLRPSVHELAGRLRAFLIPDQLVLYVGKADKSVSGRVGSYYSTTLGGRSPHAGGWFLKTLGNLDSLFVHYAQAKKPTQAETSILKTFMANLPEEARALVHDPDLPLPFANLEYREPGRRNIKRHGIEGATGC